MKTSALTEMRSSQRPRLRWPQAKRALRDVLMGPLSMKQIAVLCREFHATEHAGIPTVQALLIVADHAGGVRLRRLLKHMAEQIRQGASFADAVQWHKGRFPSFFRELINAAEASGNLEMAFEYLAEYYEEHLKLRRAFLNAIAYPMLVLLAMVLFIPLLTAYLSMIAGVKHVDIQSFLVQKLIDLAILFAEIWLIIRLRIPQALWSIFGAHLPFFGRIARGISVSRFFQCLAMLLESGLGVARSIEFAARVSGNVPLKASLAAAADRVRGGESLTEALSSSSFINDSMRAMLSVGEQSGKVDSILRKLSLYAQTETTHQLRVTVLCLEPILILWLFFGWVVLLGVAALLLGLELRYALRFIYTQARKATSRNKRY